MVIITPATDYHSDDSVDCALRVGVRSMVSNRWRDGGGCAIPQHISVTAGSKAMSLLTANVKYSGKQCLPGSIELSAMAHKFPANVELYIHTVVPK
jgi:hypothetical protein